MAKVMSLFINCDKMVGSQFEQGLAKLKALVEGDPTRAAADRLRSGLAATREHAFMYALQRALFRC